jgi:hypothetical protein
MIVEAGDEKMLSRGMQGLLSILARRINRLQGLLGPLWRERYHARPLKTPKEVRSALVYVLQNGAQGCSNCGREVLADQMGLAMAWADR